jgi:hypothetical protein
MEVFAALINWPTLGPGNDYIASEATVSYRMELMIVVET